VGQPKKRGDFGGGSVTYAPSTLREGSERWASVKGGKQERFLTNPEGGTRFALDLQVGCGKSGS